MNTRTNLISRKGLKQILLSSVSLTLIFTMLILSSFSVRAENSNKNNYTGEEVFRGVMMGEGEVADLFPEIWEKYRTDLQNKEISAFRDAVVSEIKAKDPDFFSKFGEEMQSGDHLRIQVAMKDGATKFKSVLQNAEFAQKFKDQSQEDYEAGKASNNVRVVVEIYIAHEVAILHYVALIVREVVFGAQLDEGSMLYKERLVDSIVARLDKNA